MRFSTVFELLVIFLLIAFAAYGRVIDRDEFGHHRAIRAINDTRQGNIGVQIMSLKQAAENVNRYCRCNTDICNCCRDFNIPLVQLQGPACASLQYLKKDNLAVQLSMGENILTSTIVNGQKPKAVCFPMPGGLTKFCGRIYSIQREVGDQAFKACLALELQSSSELEAALRVSCFRFGPEGVKLRPAEKLPIVEDEDKPSDDDDDDEDFFDIGVDDDEDEDDEEEDEDAPEGNAVPGSSSGTSEDDEEEDEDESDLLGFGALIDILTGEDSTNKKKKPAALPGTTEASILPFTIPILPQPAPGTPTIALNENPESNAISSTKPTTKPAAMEPLDAIGNSVSDTQSTVIMNDEKIDDPSTTQLPSEVFTNFEETDVPVANTEPTPDSDQSPSKDKIGSGSSNIEYVVKPEKQTNIIKKVSINGNKQSLTSGSANAIKNDVKKPVVSSVIITKPIKPVQNHVAPLASANIDNQVEDDDEEDILGDDLEEDEEEEEDNEEDATEDEDDEKYGNEHENDEDKEEDEKDELVEDEANEQNEEDDKDEVDELIDDDDDEDDDEEAEEEADIIEALAQDNETKSKNKVADNIAANHEEDDADYGLDLAQLLARKRTMRSGRQSKVMRL